MRIRGSSIRPLIVAPLLLLIALFGLLPSIAGARQEGATPAPSTVGVGGGGLSSGLPRAAPGYLLSLRRGVFEPGGYVSLHHHPGTLAFWIESGELTYAVADGTAHVTRAAVDGTPGPTEAIGPGMTTTLRPGDAVFEEAVRHVSRNDGTEPVTLWIAALVEADQPQTVFETATPVS